MSRPLRPLDEYLTCAQVAPILHMKNPAEVSRLCYAGKIPASKPFGKWLIHPDDLAELIESKRNVA